MKRRQFVTNLLALTGTASLLKACQPKHRIGGSILGAQAALGHRLREGGFSAPATAAGRHSVIIIGAGISGLSAGRWLMKQNITDFRILDLEKIPGGNAAWGSNSVSSFPLGAHYIPIPNLNLPEYHAFLQEAGVIRSINESGVPAYNEFHLCFDPEERLYLNGRWQDGLVPHFGLSSSDHQQMDRFLQQMQWFREAKGIDGKDAFSIPVDHSSEDNNFRQLDHISMKDWLRQEGYSSPYVHGYVNYCTRDDFGTTHDRCSAWFGIHYHAARKGKASNAQSNDVLTWPEGNGFLAQQLLKQIGKRVQSNALTTSVQLSDNEIEVVYFDATRQQSFSLRADQCVLAVPQMIAARLLHDEARRERIHEHVSYAPWMVANLRVQSLEERSGAGPSWDNVIFNSPSLGYVDATHQLIGPPGSERNLTYYWPLTAEAPSIERTRALSRTHENWADLILADLEKIHPDIRAKTQTIDVQLWGHAMAQPLPGTLNANWRKELAASIGNRIHFAHTDLAGISIFEEAFYQGIRAAGAVEQQLVNP